MTLKKTQSPPYHIGNRLHGQRGHAQYAIMNGDVVIGTAWATKTGWDAFRFDAGGILRLWRPFRTLADLRAFVAKQTVA